MPNRCYVISLEKYRKNRSAAESIEFGGDTECTNNDPPLPEAIANLKLHRITDNEIQEFKNEYSFLPENVDELIEAGDISLLPSPMDLQDDKIDDDFFSHKYAILKEIYCSIRSGEILSDLRCTVLFQDEIDERFPIIKQILNLKKP